MIPLSQPNEGGMTFADPDETVPFTERLQGIFTRTPELPTTGILESGNIDLGKRPVVKNPDGSISTVRSMGVNIDGKEVLIPTVSDDGRIMAPEEAIETFKQTGKHLGKFDTPENATSFAEKLHDEQARRYGGNGLITSLAQLAPLTSPSGYIASSIAKDLIQHPGEFSNLFGAAERATMLVETVTSRNIATEQAYERRIKAVKEATGVELENPLRGGFRDELARAAREDVMIRSQSAEQEPAAPLTGGAIFERKLADLRAAHPDKLDALAFGDINAEANAIAKGAEEEYEAARKDTKLGLPANLAAQFGGAAWGMRRDPLFVGSLFAGPTTAVGRTVAARIASAGLFQGLYNMGISALEQPVVQQWRAELGLRSGVVPAAENVGLAFLFGAIPGAAFRGVHEIPSALRAPVQRVLDGVPQGGDIEKALVAAKHALGEIDAEMRSPMAAPPPATGFTRFYHGGVDYEGGPRWLTPDIQYARGYAGESGKVHYVDIPNDSPHLVKSFDDTGTDQVAPFVHFEAPEEIARNLKVLEGARGPRQTPIFGRTETAAIRLGEEMDAAEKITQPRPARDVSPELHDDLTQAAQRYADDPDNAPSPAGVAATNSLSYEPAIRIEGKIYRGGSHVDALDRATKELGTTVEELLEKHGGSQRVFDELDGFVDRNGEFVTRAKAYDSVAKQEISDRIASAQPRNLAEAQKAASDAIEDIGNRDSIARTREQMDAERLPAPAPLPEGVKPPPASSKDPLDKVAIMNEDGKSVRMISAQAAAREGERELRFAELIRECK